MCQILPHYGGQPRVSTMHSLLDPTSCFFGLCNFRPRRPKKVLGSTSAQASGSAMRSPKLEFRGLSCFSAQLAIFTKMTWCKIVRIRPRKTQWPSSESQDGGLAYGSERFQRASLHPSSCAIFGEIHATNITERSLCNTHSSNQTFISRRHRVLLAFGCSER